MHTEIFRSKRESLRIVTVRQVFVDAISDNLIKIIGAARANRAF